MLHKLIYRARILCGLLRELLLYLLLYPAARLLYGRRNIWLLAERGTDARDNAYHLYRYIRRNQPELEAYYVITDDSPDRARLEECGNLVRFRSLRHYLLFLGAKVIASTHIMGASPDRNFYTFMQERFGLRLVRGKLVFLQHGITKDLMPGFFYENARLDLFICGAEPEYEYIKKEFHYPSEAVRYTGFARYDNLQSFRCKRQILIMPTWRSWLIYNAEAGETLVKNSAYLRAWSGLLRSKRLAELAERYDADVIFYPHQQMQQYLGLFPPSAGRIRIADFAHYDVQTLLRESMLLITDFSSVFFDFAYMKKPVLFYQFDEEEFFRRHYQKGYFDYRRDGFGEVETELEPLLDRLGAYLADGCRPNPRYEQRREAFFKLSDARNCERIVNVMNAMLKTGKEAI